MQTSSNKKQQRSSIPTSLKDTSSPSEFSLTKSQRSSSTKSLNYSSSKSSSTTLKQAGILTVNSGQQRSTSHYDLRSGGDVYCGSNINNNNSTEFSQIALKKLQRISTFEPILSSAKIAGHLTSTTSQPIALNSQSIQLPSSSSTTTTVPSTSFTGKKQFIPNLLEFDCEEKLVNISSIYEQYFHEYASEVSQNQSNIIILQNKIDRDISQLVNILQSREKGVNVIHHSTSSTFFNTFNSPKKDNVTTHVMHDSIKLSGSQQIESIVLLSSQIFGLLTQCNELSNQLMNSINNLNEILPE
ncbi:hypothetical protein MN116_008305 [Schistosoma mekongi]|uniref:Uncharacterized protein n=1 Tax=Schistosoma mekongi TaxID=38744 RepID=A0AAE1Z793_SCHME|nr:hypothetical protein MN116_008305 [Schistosoma mekongi]